MYGTIMCFDGETEDRIIQLCDKLATLNISTYHIDPDGKRKRPHLTLADYNTLNVKQYVECLQGFTEQRKPIEINLSVLGSFPGGGTLFLSPTMTEELFTFHKSYHHELAAFQDKDHSLYLPDRWVPHCTIANHLTRENFIKAFDVVTQSFQPIRAHISEVVLIQLLFENGSVIGSEPIDSCKL